MELEFEWEQEKEKSNLSKHGVSFHEGATVLAIRCPGLSRILTIPWVNNGS